jgi:hypothetical protein
MLNGRAKHERRARKYKLTELKEKTPKRTRQQDSKTAKTTKMCKVLFVGGDEKWDGSQTVTDLVGRGDGEMANGSDWVEWVGYRACGCGWLKREIR